MNPERFEYLIDLAGYEVIKHEEYFFKHPDHVYLGFRPIWKYVIKRRKYDTINNIYAIRRKSATN
jgi:hypothetical protein